MDVKTENQNLSRADTAKEYFLQGYNCSQAVALAFADLCGTDKNSLLKIASSFGGGMGRLREVCGALTGTFIVMGLISGYDTPERGERKLEHYAHIQNLAARFEKENGSIICREILGLTVKHSSPKPEERTPRYYATRPCPQKVYSAAKILEEYLKEIKIL
ncbi:MAG: C_GCAxxG_C_C family protein [Oscillospiraceae bacterium]|nr:C_GCAxxG_C_C family protein [Candidatus Equicaccousia limihippi]